MNGSGKDRIPEKINKFFKTCNRIQKSRQENERTNLRIKTVDLNNRIRENRNEQAPHVQIMEPIRLPYIKKIKDHWSREVLDTQGKVGQTKYRLNIDDTGK